MSERGFSDPVEGRRYWERQATPATVGLADRVLDLLQDFDRTLELKYNQRYIGIWRDGLPCDFVKFRPQKTMLGYEVNIPKTDQADRAIAATGVRTLPYHTHWGYYRLRLNASEVREHADVLKWLGRLAYERRLQRSGGHA